LQNSPASTQYCVFFLVFVFSRARLCRLGCHRPQPHRLLPRFFSTSSTTTFIRTRNVPLPHQVLWEATLPGPFVSLFTFPPLTSSCPPPLPSLPRSSFLPFHVTRPVAFTSPPFYEHLGSPGIEPFRSSFFYDFLLLLSPAFIESLLVSSPLLPIGVQP